MQFKKGDRIIYRSIAGPEYPGVVISVGIDGSLYLDIYLGTRTMYPLASIRPERVRLQEMPEESTFSTAVNH